MHTARLGASVVLASVSLWSCGPTSPDSFRRLAFQFADGTDGWQAGVSDYSSADTNIDFVVGLRPLPFDTTRHALFLSSVNHSDDVFMFDKVQVGGLGASATYDAEFVVDIASSAGTGCAGIGGAPGEGVLLKAGVSGIEPDASGSHRGACPPSSSSSIAR